MPAPGHTFSAEIAARDLSYSVAPRLRRDYGERSSGYVAK